MRNLGKGICIVGTLVAFLFVPMNGHPTNFLGITEWGFVLGEEQFLGMGLLNYKFIHYKVWIPELILINCIGLALFLFGKKKGRSRP